MVLYHQACTSQKEEKGRGKSVSNFSSGRATAEKEVNRVLKPGTERRVMFLLLQKRKKKPVWFAEDDAGEFKKKTGMRPALHDRREKKTKGRGREVSETLPSSDRAEVRRKGGPASGLLSAR